MFFLEWVDKITYFIIWYQTPAIPIFAILIPILPDGKGQYPIPIPIPTDGQGQYPIPIPPGGKDQYQYQ